MYASSHRSIHALLRRVARRDSSHQSNSWISMALQSAVSFAAVAAAFPCVVTNRATSMAPSGCLRGTSSMRRPFVRLIECADAAPSLHRRASVLHRGCHSLRSQCIYRAVYAQTHALMHTERSCADRRIWMNSIRVGTALHECIAQADTPRTQSDSTHRHITMHTRRAHSRRSALRGLKKQQKKNEKSSLCSLIRPAESCESIIQI